MCLYCIRCVLNKMSDVCSNSNRCLRRIYKLQCEMWQTSCCIFLLSPIVKGIWQQTNNIVTFDYLKTYTNCLNWSESDVYIIHCASKTKTLVIFGYNLWCIRRIFKILSQAIFNWISVCNVLNISTLSYYIPLHQTFTYAVTINYILF